MMNPRMQRPRALPHRQRGAVMVLIVVALASMLLMSALALDGGHMLLNKARLQNAVDAAALSGAKTLSQVMGTGNASSQTRDAALNTLSLNANASGNGELAAAITAAGGVGAFAQVELATDVEGPFAFPGPVDARFVRVTVADYALPGFFWGFAQAFGAGGLADKAVAAIATAGPSQTAPCDLAPLLVCGDENQYDPGTGMFWGYRFGDLEVLKSAAGNAPAIGPGNFQLIRLGDNTGAADIREALAGGIDQCLTPGEPVETEPGNTVGPVAQGLNTRFGQYSGPISPGDYPPDKVISFTTPRMTYNDSTSPPQVEHQNQPVTSNDGDLATASTSLYDYNDWLESVANCPSGCEANGVLERRLLKIVVGNCDGASGGQTSVPVLGYGCFFLVQTVSQQGNQAQIFGQFVMDCAGDSVPGPVVDDVGPKIIQLYKTYLTPTTPSPDS
ncbi:pilus assembly protein [Pseudomonas lalucatii]|uniref:Pilus assembly protein n=2 Tax=Pseudomonas lalucatii TaxID=1424203 RepID=A0ABS5PY40_9PSED|nr:pilus assembly protein [Pseudomonas lalucatii]